MMVPYLEYDIPLISTDRRRSLLRSPVSTRTVMLYEQGVVFVGPTTYTTAMTEPIHGRLQCGMPGTIVVPEPVCVWHLHAAHIAVIQTIGAFHHNSATHQHSHRPQMDWNVWGIRVGLLRDI